MVDLYTRSSKNLESLISSLISLPNSSDVSMHFRGHIEERNLSGPYN